MAVDDLLSLWPSDTIVPVMGLTGVGKSAFIEKLTGQDAGVGHGLVSATNEIGIYLLENYGRRIFLVDTPGFDDTRCSDTETFKELAFFLGQTYKNRVRLGGILYLHRITDNRVTGSAMKSFNLFKNICGPEAAKLAVLVTTMWDQLPPGSPGHLAAAEREKELVYTDNYWGSMNRMGSCTSRWTGDTLSATSILERLIWASDYHNGMTLQLQHELIDKQLDMDDTCAGKVLTSHYGNLWQKLRQELQQVRRSYDQAARVADRRATEQLLAQKLELESRIRRTEEGERGLRDDLESIFREKSYAYRKLLDDARKQEANASRILNDGQQKLKRMQHSQHQEAQVFETATKRYYQERATIAAASKLQLLDQRQTQRLAKYRRRAKEMEELKQLINRDIAKAQKRQVVKRNMLPLLGILGGIAAIAAGGATMQMPVVAAGITVFGAAVAKLNLSRTEGIGTTKDED